MYVFLRQLGAEALVVAVNSAEEARTVSFDAPAVDAAGSALLPVYGADSGALDGAALTLALGARSGSVWVVAR